MKLLYAIASTLFCVAAPAAASTQSLHLSLMSALCSDDYYEDTAGQCGAISAGEDFTIEAILAKYGIVITGDIDEDVMVQPRKEDPVLADDKSNTEPANEQEAIASKVVTGQPPLEIGAEAADDVATTGPTARRIPAAAEDVDDRTIE